MKRILAFLKTKFFTISIFLTKDSKLSMKYFNLTENFKSGLIAGMCSHGFKIGGAKPNYNGPLKPKKMGGPSILLLNKIPKNWGPWRPLQSLSQAVVSFCTSMI